MLLCVLNKPSRFDIKAGVGHLITGTAGVWFDRELRKNGLTRNDIIITTADAFARNRCVPPSNVSAILLMGEHAFRLFHPDNRVSLDELRGYPYRDEKTGIIWLSTFAPQDCMDVRNYESMFNAAEGDIADTSSDDTEESDVAIKAHGKTRRKNYRFWFAQDLKKIIRLMRAGTLRQLSVDFNYHPYINLEDIEPLLLRTKNKNLYFDIETDPKTLDITVMSFSFGDNNIYTIPVRRYDYTLAYTTRDMARIFRALAVAFRDNTLVTHNGHGFDCHVLTRKYKIPHGDSHYDTMIAHHRIFPEVEKSLGHVISLYTDEPYHKNEADCGYVPFNSEQERQLWKYNAKDVAVLPVLHRALEKYAENVGATVSIEDAMDLIPCYLTMSYRGIRVNTKLIQRRLDENNRRVTQLLRILRILVGYDLNPQSPKQMRKYLFKELGLKPVGYTNKNEPSTDEKALLKLSIKETVPIIPVILEIRKTGKLSSMLEFESWEDTQQLTK